MNTKTIVGLSFAAVFAVTLMASPAFAGGPPPIPGYLDIQGTPIVDIKTTGNDNNQNSRIKVHIDVAENIPLDGNSLFGYAIMTDKTPLNNSDEDLVADNVHVLVTHLPIDDTAADEDDTGLHTHVLDLTGASSNCAGVGAGFEVDVASSIANKGFDLESNWEVDGTTAWIGYVPEKRVNSSDVDVVVAFEVLPLPPSATTIGELTNLCVKVHDAVTFFES
jgi:hypothetical protein